jgi:phospholipase C
MWFALDRQIREEKLGHPFPVIPVLLPGADLTPCFLFLSTWIDLRSGVDGFASAEMLEAFEHAMSAATRPLAAAEHSADFRPYRGLEAFREEDAAFFAGRTAFANDLLRFTLDKNLVAVVGPSGSGKSSVVHAGLVPLLRRQLPPATTWDVVTFTPGGDPFHRLASALISLLEPDGSETDRLAEAHKLGDRLAAGEIKLESVIGRVIEKSNGTGRLLFVADQFEELFTLTAEEYRRPFAGTLLGALGKARFTLLLTLRADFYSQIITLDRALSDRLASAQVNIGALTRDELRETITCPAKLVGLEFEPGLVERILDDVGSEPGNLPLLEFALTGLWSNRQGRTLTNYAYNEIGGVTGALAQRAESEFARFTAAEQTAARRLFSRLVRVARPEEGAEDTRQRLELHAADTETEKVAQALARPEVRLLVMGRPEQDAADANPTVEVAHEALIRNWDRLRGWLNEDREFLLWRQRTRIQVEQWEQHGGDPGYLLRGVPLSEADRWMLGRRHDLTAAEQRFIEESIGLSQRERAQARSMRTLRRTAFSLGLLFLLALAAVSLLELAKRQADKNAADAKQIAQKTSFYVWIAQAQYAELARRAQEEGDSKGAEYYRQQSAAARDVALLNKEFAVSTSGSQAMAGIPGSPIRHVIVLMMENRSFDHMLGSLKGADPRIDGITDQLANPGAQQGVVRPQPLAQYQGQLDPDPDTHFAAVDLQIFGGDTSSGRFAAMNGFVKSYFNQMRDIGHSQKIMYYFKQTKLPVLTTLATEFAVCDHWFSSVPGPSVPNRAFADYGTSFGQVGNGSFKVGDYKSIFERIVEKGGTAKIYRYEGSGLTPETVNLAQHHPELFATFTQFLADAEKDSLPNYSLIQPNYIDHDGTNGPEIANDEHPDHNVLAGEIFIATVYNALRRNQKVWESSVLLITYSNHGGIYDHVPPSAVMPDGFVAPVDQTHTGKSFAFDRLGVRVPAVIVSPYVRKGTVDHSVYEHASIPATLSELFLLHQQSVSPREKTAQTFDRVLTLPTPRSDTPTFQVE